MRCRAVADRTRFSSRLVRSSASCGQSAGCRRRSLACGAGFTATTSAGWSEPSALTVVRLADALGVKPSEVFKRAERRRL